MNLASLLQLMHRPKLGQSMKIGAEDRICIDFADRMRAWTLERRLKAVWSHIPNELAGGTKNAQIRYALAKALGMMPGASDYMFLWEKGSAALEFKTKTGKQTDNQTLFEKWCHDQKVPYHVVRSADEGEARLRELGILQ